MHHPAGNDSSPTEAPAAYPIALHASTASWTGVARTTSLPALGTPPVVLTQETWHAFWSATGKPLPPPEVDFRTHYLYVATRDVDDPNDWSITLTVDESGRLQASILQTLVGRIGPPSESSRYWIYPLQRAGIDRFR